MKLILTPSKKANHTDPLSNNGGRIHEGSSYQANIPPRNLSSTASNDHNATLLWKPTNLIHDNDLTDYIDHAYRKHHMSEEQALAILQICKYKIPTSKLLMQQYTSKIDSWTNEEKFLFEQAYQFHGKVFSHIKQMLPQKTIAELVNYYYTWKKTRSYKSLMDKHEKQSQFMPCDIEDESEEDENIIYLNDRNTLPVDENSIEDQECCNCDKIGKSLNATPKGTLCDECFIYWKNSGLMRPDLYRSKPTVKKVKRPPKNMSIDFDTDETINKLEEDIRHELSFIQSLNQSIEILTKQSRYEIETMKIPFLELNRNSTNDRTTTWSTEEILLAIQAFAKYGKDFNTISRIIGPTKNVHDIETFFLEYRQRYQLDEVIDMSSKSIENLQNDSSLISR